jgi:polar amino acid transport system substrate-binding protein
VKHFISVLYVILFGLSGALPSFAQTDTLRVTTVTRAPFSMQVKGVDTGFSIDLLAAIAKDLNLKYEIKRETGFAPMLESVVNGNADAAVANISITAAREEVMDFTLPIFSSGLQIMIANENATSPLWAAIFKREIGLAILIAAGLLFGGGMLMWGFERRSQEYFNRPIREAMFPSFWWALNLVVNGGFEERMPRSALGRMFAVILVVSSLFIVSIFVAQITAAMTVSAIQSNVQSINDLDGRKVGTMAGSTASEFLTKRDLSHTTYDDLDNLLHAFEDKTLDAIVFDGPILAYYVQHQKGSNGRLLDKVFKPENYGIALQTNSPLRESMNQAILRLRENGTYDELLIKYFGNTYQR